MSKRKGKPKPAERSAVSVTPNNLPSQPKTQAEIPAKKHSKIHSTFWSKTKALFALCLIVAFVGLAFLMTSTSQKSQSQSTPNAARNATQSAFSPRNSCRTPPAFMRSLSANQGFGAGSALSTSERDLIGLAVVDFDPQTGQRMRVWQHPSWRTAGNLSAFALDQRGDIYVIPAPRVNLLDNPPALQNRVYRIDGTTGEMTLALEFPVAAAVNQRNPYAGLGLSYDCALDSLFLTSVAGSTPNEQRGKVFRIALRPSVKIASTLAGVDMFAVTSVGKPDQVAAEKHVALLLGSARSAELLQIELDANGDFPPAASAVLLLSIAGRGPDGNDRARKIDIAADGSLSVHGTRFAYNLAQPSAQEKATRYLFAFDAGLQSYQFQGWKK